MKNYALEFGRWRIYRDVLFSKKGAKLKQKVEKTRTKLELQRGTTHQFLYHRQSGKNKLQTLFKDSAMESIVGSMIELINERLPISDDLLLLCLKYEMGRSSKKTFMDSKLWQAIERAVNIALTLPLKRKEFVWFKSYLMTSAIWYENVSIDDINNGSTCDEDSKENANKAKEKEKEKDKSKDKKNKEKTKDKSKNKDKNKDKGKGKTSTTTTTTTATATATTTTSTPAKAAPIKTSTSKNRIARRVCSCDKYLKITTPMHVVGGDTFKCAECARKIGDLEYFYFCNNKITNGKHGDRHGYCLSCGKIKKGYASVTSDQLKAVKNRYKKKGQKLTTKQAQTILLSGDDTYGAEDSNLNEKSGVLFDKLLKIVQNQLVTQKEFLKRHIDDLAENNSKEWEQVTNFEEFYICDEIRQDSMISRETGQELIKYPNLTSFSEKELNDYGMKNLYESNAYLSELVVKAHLINGVFHETMGMILEDDSNVKYRGGPVKQIARAQTKSETDYANKAFPNAASVVGMYFYFYFFCFGEYPCTIIIGCFFVFFF